MLNVPDSPPVELVMIWNEVARVETSTLMSRVLPARLSVALSPRARLSLTPWGPRSAWKVTPVMDNAFAFGTARMPTVPKVPGLNVPLVAEMEPIAPVPPNLPPAPTSVASE